MQGGFSELRDRRASAEGCAKFGNRDRRNFYVIARGSVFECSSIVSFLCVEKEISIEIKEELGSSCEEIAKMSFAMIKNLQKD